MGIAKFTSATDGEKVSVIAENVFAYTPHESGKGTHIVSSAGFGFHVAESNTSVGMRLKKALDNEE